jgi:hypothetical protein
MPAPWNGAGLAARNIGGVAAGEIEFPEQDLALIGSSLSYLPAWPCRNETLWKPPALPRMLNLLWKQFLQLLLSHQEPHRTWERGNPLAIRLFQVLEKKSEGE